MNGNTLEIYFQQANWAAVDEAMRLRESALPTIKKYSQDQDYQKRQIAVECAGVIGGEAAAQILMAGLKDDNINVRLSAAKTLERNPNSSATEAVIKLLNESDEEVLREILALAAGHLPVKHRRGAEKTLNKRTNNRYRSMHRWHWQNSAMRKPSKQSLVNLMTHSRAHAMMLSKN